MKPVGFRLLVLGAGLTAGAAFAAPTTLLTATLDLEMPAIRRAADGWLDVAAPAGYQISANPARPALPVKSVVYALPPDTDIHTLDLVIKSADYADQAAGAPVRPAPPWRVASDPAVAFYGDAAEVMDGRDRAVYARDAFYPAAPVAIENVMRMRKWLLVRVRVQPILYNPVQGTLRACRRVAFGLTGARTGIRAADADGDDTVMDAAALALVANPAAAQSWYAANGTRAVPTNRVYVIMTTDAILNESTNLYGLISHKRNLGYTVHVVTETKVNGNAASNGWNEVTGQSPNEKADRIRKWLQNTYTGLKIQYVLLIGNPDPVSGDLPMKRCDPVAGGGTYIYPADGYFSDLTGNWDLDGDTRYGEESEDGGVGGVDFAPEVWVGRIPVYTNVTGWRTTLKNIVWKSIKYELESSIGWRKSALLPESWSDYITDGAYLGECARTNYLVGAGYSAWTLYQQGSIDTNYNSPFPSSEELLGNATVNRWMTNSYGLTLWWGHGWPQGAVVQGGGTLFQSAHCPFLRNNTPAAVFMVSCSCASPYYNDNVSYEMLKNGGIASVAATEVSWYYYCKWSPSDAKGMNASMGYDFMRKLAADGKTFGQALAEVKYEVSGWWNNLFTFNLYGDPSLAMTSQGADTDSDRMPDLWETANNFNPTNSADAAGDADADGYTNREEYENGTNPRSLDAPAAAYASMTVAGTFTGWNPAANNMRLVSDYLWQSDLTLTNVAAGAQFKFTANGNWTANWGDNGQTVFTLPMCGGGEADGANIACSNALNGRYRFTFNEQSAVYRLEAAPPTDSDNDGIPDDWENAHGLNAYSAADAGADPDHDGYTNLQEYQNNTDPQVWNAPLSNLNCLSVAGTFNTWNPAASNMCLISNYVWRFDTTFAQPTNVEFKFAANGGWTINWGDNDQAQFTVPISGVGESYGANILSGTLNGSYRFTFHEQTLEYRLESIATPDTDADGMSDEWEIAHGLNFRSAQDAWADGDADGLFNRDELALGGDPALKDTDGDGMDDLAEAIAGTALNDARSWFGGNALAATPTNFTLSWPGATGRTYAIFSCTGQLANVNWTPVPNGTNLPGQAGAMSFSIPTPADAQFRFFKIRVQR